MSYVIMSWQKVVSTYYDISQVYIDIFKQLCNYLAGIYLNTQKIDKI